MQNPTLSAMKSPLRARALLLLLAHAAACSADGSGGGSDAGSDTTPDTSGSADDTTADTGGSGDDTTTDTSGDGTVDTTPQPRTLTLWDNARITSNGSDPSFQNVRATIDWGAGPFASVMLVMELDTTCFPFSRWADDPPPSGQNWPPLCDAFDRNYEVTLDDPESPDDPPAIELVRAITPFGGPLRYEADITDIANARPGARRLRAHITTYSDGAGQVSGSNGGWNVSGRVVVVDGPAPRKVLGVYPLYNGTYPAPYDPVERTFDVPEGTTRAVVEYRVTGHGGARDPSSTCIGPAEEFCKRYHHVTVDGDETVYRPWRDDCDTLCTEESARLGTQTITYCAENPTGSMASVRAPRANWCPGSVTPPRLFDVATNGAGSHQFGFFIEDVVQDGGWRVSAVAIAYGE
jgi:hypothetical protein